MTLRPYISATAMRRVALCLAVLAMAVFATGDAPAQKPPCSQSPNEPCWPPPEDATLDDLAQHTCPEEGSCTGYYWPDDPGYGYSDDTDGHWNYYSFVPTQTGSNTLRPDEFASGMSIDMAWRLSTGNDSVRIAVTDSGIKWDEDDIIPRAWLNAAELENHKPTHSDGSPCADIGTDLIAFDCNDDGIFNVEDYAETPTLSPLPAVEGEGNCQRANCPLGDVNGNGWLDGGDIIQNFSDDIDDDQNGYVDDICGWDFMKDDNNPYDDTRYGHGTGEARDSVGSGNNGKHGIGTCPNCRYIPMRVGDSFIADSQAFAQAVIYATDNGARIVQSALGTISMTNFTQAALDYAYENGVLVVASMADENARHHNMPTTANHTLPVHAITYSPASGKITNVRTFQDFNGCTNFGGQNFLSVSGTSCSSEAVGRLSGMSGLLFAAGIKYGYPDLTPNEAMQLWFHTTDDIDVPESREGPADERPYYYSQPGFDQRFGYGRTNANGALEAVRDGKIPPEVDIVRPYWFEVLYKDQLQGPVEIRGTIAAKRATSYDYTVEWAPGVEPLDGAFEEIASERNVGAEIVTGGTDADADPIALFDVRTIDVTHEPDADSPLGENQYTFTVRIRATANYGGDVGPVAGEMRRTYYVYEDPDLAKGFPMYLGDSGEASPKMADLDGDGVADLLYPTAGGRLHALRLTPEGPEPLEGWPFLSDNLDGLASEAPVPGKPSYRAAPAYDDGDGPIDVGLARQGIMTPAVADVDDDGKLEVVAITWNATIYVIEHDGTVKDGWPIRLPEVPSCPRDGTPATGQCMNVDDVVDRGAFGAPVLVDMNKDGKLDIVQAGFDGKVHVFDARDGSIIDGWPVQPHYDGPFFDDPGTGRIFVTPAVGDFNGDGYPEVLVGNNEKLGEGGFAGAVYLIDGRGTNAETPYMPNWPATISSFNLFPLVAEGTPNSGVIGQIDGTLAAVMHGNASAPFILPMDPGEQANELVTPPNGLPGHIDADSGERKPGVGSTAVFGKFSKASPEAMFPLFASPSLGDIDQDGTLDVVAQGSSLSVANALLGGGGIPGQQLLTVWSGKSGQMLPGAPYVLEDYSFFNSQVIADLNGDDYPEVIAGSAGYYLHAYDGCGREPEGWPKFTGQWIIPTPAIGDIDGDNSLEIAVGTRSGWLYVWHTEATNDSQVLWESFHHDLRNTGNYDEPLSVGNRDRKASEPMTEAFCAAALAPPAEDQSLKVGGGCGCIVGAPTQKGNLAALFGGLLAALALGFRRRED